MESGRVSPATSVDGRDGVSGAEPRLHVPGDGRGGVEVIARDDDRTADLAGTLTRVPSGTICPHLFRTWSRLMSSTRLRYSPSAWTVTCQWRPNWLKLLT